MAVIDIEGVLVPYFGDIAQQGYGTIKNIDYYIDNVREKNRYDYLLIYDGIRYAERGINRNIIIVSDISSESLNSIKNMELIRKNRSMLVLRNTLSRGLTGKYFIQSINAANLVECVEDIPFDSVDNEYRYRLQYERIRSIRHISCKMEKCLAATVCYFTGKTQSLVAKAMRYSREGKIIEHSILG